MQRPWLAALVMALGLALGLALAGCRTGERAAEAVPAPAQASTAGAASAGPQSSTWPIAPRAEAARSGTWRGGPETASAKLPSGIAVYYRVEASQAAAPGIFTVSLRLEDVEGDDATLQLNTVDGAQLAAISTRAWRLAPHAPALVSVQVAAPPGDSYLQVLTSQRGRISSRSILLSVPGAKAQGPAAARPGQAVDAAGGPIIRMQTTP